MDDISLSYVDNYNLRTYTATLQRTISYSVDREQLANTAIDHEYLICAQLIDRINDSFYNYRSLAEVVRNLREVHNRLNPELVISDLLDIAITRIEAIIAPSSRLVSKQRIHQLLQGGTYGPVAHYDQRHRVQITADTATRHYNEARDTVSATNTWIPGTSTTRTDNSMAPHSNSSMHF